MAHYRQELLDRLRERLAPGPELVEGKMMGHPGFRLASNNKLALFVYDDGICLKLPEPEYSQALEQEAMRPFQPPGMGKPMGRWLVWSLPEPGDYEEEWGRWLGAALEAVAQEPANPPRRRKG